jgi:hypothetical protein
VNCIIKISLKDIKFGGKNGVFKIMNLFWEKMSSLIKVKLKFQEAINQNKLKNK